MSAVVCQRCGHEGPHVEYPSGKHLRADCGNCGRYIRFLRQPGSEHHGKDPSTWTWSHPARARMRELPPSEAQLEVVRRSEWRWYEPFLRHRDEASKLISWILAETAPPGP